MYGDKVIKLHCLINTQHLFFLSTRPSFSPCHYLSIARPLCAYSQHTWNSEFLKCKMYNLCSNSKIQVTLYRPNPKVCGPPELCLPNVYLKINLTFSLSQVLLLLSINPFTDTIIFMIFIVSKKYWNNAQSVYIFSVGQLNQSNMNITIQIAYCAVWYNLWPHLAIV